MIVFLTIWIVISIILIIRSKDEYSPFLWVVIAYSFLLGMSFLDIVHYYYPARISSYLYLLLGITAFLLGSKLGVHLKTKWSQYYYDHDKELTISLSVKRKLTFLGIIGTIIYIFDLVRLNKLYSFIAILNSHSDFSISLIGVVGSILNPLCLILWIISCLEVSSERRRFKPSSLIYVVFFLLPNMLTSGRQAFFFMIIVTGIIFIPLLRKGVDNIKIKKNKKRLARIVVIIAIVIGVYVSFVAGNRSGYVAKIDYMPKTFNASLSQNTRELCIRTGAFGEILVEFILYYTHELPSLQVLMDNFHGPYGLGGIQFHYIARRLSFLGISTDPVVSAAESACRSAGSSYHVYRTIIGSSILDFGLIFTPIFMLVLGLLVGYAKRKYMIRQTIFDKIKMVLLCASIVFSIEYSPLQEPCIAYSIIWILILSSIYIRPSNQ